MPSRTPLSLLLLLALLLASLAGALAPPTTRAADPPPRTIDDFESALRSGSDGNGIPVGFFTAQDGGSSVSFGTAAPPAPVPGLATPNQVLQMRFQVSVFGVVIHGFENDAANTWVTQDWSAYGGMAFWLYGTNSGTDLFVDLIDNRNPASTRDDAERFTVSFEDNWSGWRLVELPFDSFTRKEIGNGAPNDGLTLTEVHGWAFGSLTTSGPQTFYLDQVELRGAAPVRPLTLGFTSTSISVVEGQIARVTVRLSRAAESPVAVSYRTLPAAATADRDYTPAAGRLTFAPGVTRQTFTVATLPDTTYEGDEGLLLQLENIDGAEAGIPTLARLLIVDNDAYDPALIDDFERSPDLFRTTKNAVIERAEIAAGSADARPGQSAYEGMLRISRSNPGRPPALISRRFPQGEDWSAAEGLSFWFNGTGSGRRYSVQLLDNAAPDPGPSGWQLAWSDEFDAPAGTPPDPATWTHEIGDGTANGIPGWGNSELQYYTDSTDNAAHDGAGNLQITVRPTGADAPRCYYGPCRFTSSRLISWHKAEFAYGRVETRIKVPRGAGLWPAFWMLGTDIDRVGWPQTGEIDVMEHVGREPKRVFGTIHGPGYSGGQSFGNTYDFAADVADEFHTYAVEWQPNRIVWYVDGIQYHQATPADVAPNQWVFNHPFFLLLNVAIGGNFGGPVGDNVTFPQSMAVDYVRVFQGRDTAERFEASFTDDVAGWRRITLPFDSFTRARQQPEGAPDDGLTLSAVHGYGIELPAGSPDPILLDQVRLLTRCADATTVASSANSGPGSLRAALAEVCRGGTIRFAPGLANTTIALSGTELTLDRDVTIDGSDAPGLRISGGGVVRPLVVNPRVNATIRDLVIADGYGFELAGGILNNGALTLERVVVANNRVTTSGVDFWKGGAGIYNGRSSLLTARDSTIRDNTVDGADGGGVYGFFDTLITLERSTVSGNTASNVGGGLRTLGDVLIQNSTLSGNIAGGWHGGAIFHTDGIMQIRSSTITANRAPGGTSGGAFVGTFTEGSPSLALRSTIVAGNTGDQCFIGRFGAGAVTLSSDGHNLAGDATCSPAGPGDRIHADARLGALAANGGATPTHALLPDSPARDAAGTDCPATDQRGIARPQGSACDIGAYEAER